MKNQKSQSGITLIALVVTIVVLLILAGVTIVYVLSDNSILKTTQQAGEDITARSIEEYASQMQIRAYAAYYANGKEFKVVESDTEGQDESGKYEVAKITDFMPADKMKVTAESVEDLKTTDGVMSGNFKVTVNKKEYKVTFTKGVAEAELATAEE